MWTQAGVDCCTHITLSRYPGPQYNEFNADERQKVYQNKHGRPRNAGPFPPTSVSLSELSSTVSALRNTVEEEQRQMAEDTRDHGAGRGDNHDDSQGVDPNRSLTRNGGTPGCSERASGDRK